jgi:hypothetical protein
MEGGDERQRAPDSEDVIERLRARITELEAWAKEWHDTAETICLLAGVSQGLGADEMVVAFRDTNDALRARVAALEAALEDFVKWSEAYPTSIFVEPDYAKAHALLQAGGMTLDALSAATLRLATQEMGKRARAALSEAIS